MTRAIKFILVALVGIGVIIVAAKDAVLRTWALAIQEYEGWFEGSRSYRNNNPGNLKYAGQAGTTGQDNAGFAIFASYAAGFAALVRQLERAVAGYAGYSPEMTLYQFFERYAPDGSAPRYSSYVAASLGVTPETKIGELWP